MARRAGLTVRLKLTLSYAGFLVAAGVLLLGAVALFLLRYIPEGDIRVVSPGGMTSFAPDRGDLLRAFTPAATVTLLFLLALGLVGGWFLAGRMLSPLTRIGDAARLAARGSLSHRIALDGPRDEIRELADVFDTMLERLEAQLAEQQRFAANASHELRTPLAISQALLEVANTDPERDFDMLIARLQDVNARAIALTEALLLLARADRRSFTQETVDLSLAAEEAVETLLPLADRRGITLDIAGESAMTHGSPALLQQLAMNLTHNAIVHNAPGGKVWIRTEVRQGSAVLIVENTGAEVPADMATILTEPFQRGTDRSRSRGTEHNGSGLGLAIADSITRAHNGTLTLTPRTGGGLIVTLRLPSLMPDG